MSQDDTLMPDVSRGDMPKPTFPVVGLGASAGGIEAITRLLKGIPPEPGMAFLIVMHLDAHRESMLVDILKPTTLMEVVQAVEETEVEPNHVYVIPPNASMGMTDGRITLRPRPEGMTPHMPIDVLFRSLAKDCHERAVGVILSGGGTDGSLGVDEIKSEGGITLAQDDATAQHVSMPRSAVSTGFIDYSLPPEEIARELVRIAAHAHVSRAKQPVEEADQSKARNFASTLEAIFALLRVSAGTDFASYKRNTIIRRIQRRVTIRHLSDLDDYYRILRDEPSELRTLYGDLLIRVTTFFRDPKVFQALQASTFPALLKERPVDAPIRIWVPGCSTGEEVYSLAICLLEAMDSHATHVPIKILATDLSEPALDRARAGVYIENIGMDVSTARLRRFFTRVNSQFKISTAIRDLCIFSRHDVTRDPPFAGLDLVSCRNLLIYFDLGLQKRVVPLFHYALKPNGSLLLGASETIGGFSDLFTLADTEAKIYRRREASARLSGSFTVPRSTEHRGITAAAPEPRASGPDPLREADRILLARFAPASVLIDEGFAVLQFRGQTGPYLEHSPGTANLDLMRMAREGLVIEIRAAVAAAAAGNAPVHRKGLRVKSSNGFRSVDIEVIPLHAVADSPRNFLILFESPATDYLSPPEPAEPIGESTGEVQRLRIELDAARQYIQSLIEDHEVTREELTSANEEVLSSNEELQSSNEELQTAKEEMQSANEELTTLNDELRVRNLELARVNDDLLNLILGLSIPIVMVSRDLRIRRFTPLAERLLNLLPSDLGRSIGDIRTGIVVPDLEETIAEVIETLQPIERDVPDRDGRWHSLRIRPYITSENRIDGAVVAFVDIDALRRSLDQLRESRDYADLIVETVPVPLVVLDRDLRLKRANGAFYRAFGLEPTISVGLSFFDLDGGIWNRPALVRGLRQVSVGEGRLDDLELEVVARDGGEERDVRQFLLNARPIARDDETGPMVLLSLENISARVRQVEQARLLAVEQTALSEAHEVGRIKDEFLAMLAHELRNPLAPILNALLTLRAIGPDQPDDFAGSVDIMERQVRHMTRLIDDLLDLARITRGKIELKRELVELAPLVENAVEASRPLIGSRRHRLDVAIPGDPIWIDADPARIEQVLVNLLNNAAKYTEPGGSIALTVTVEGTEAVARVRDSGVGISAEMLGSIFDLFTQAERTLDRSQGGLGIGLTLARTLVELHGGRIEARSDGPRLGSEFAIRLPTIRRTVRAARSSGSVAIPDPPGGDRWRVLIVDDNQDAATSLARLLRAWGCEAEAVHDGPAALAAAAASRPDVVLLDIGLPGMDGYEVARRFRADPGLGHPTLVALTGYGQESDRRKAREAGFDLHLVKPAQGDDLRSIFALRPGGLGPGPVPGT